MGFMQMLIKIRDSQKFTVSKTVDILDWRLALAQRLLQLLFFAYFIMSLVINQGHYYHEVPLGRIASSYVSRGDLTDAQKKDSDYCDTDTSPTFTWDGCTDDPFWCDDNVRCTKPQFNQMYFKGDSGIWLFSYNKDAQYRTLPSCDDESDDSNSCLAEEHFDEVDGRCTCLRVRNYWMKGVEKLRLNVLPTYTHTSTIGTHEKDDFRTEVYSEAGGKVKEFGAGEELSFSVEELLDIVGTSLDDTNPAAEAAFESADGSKYDDDKQVYRMTGMEIELQFEFSGVIDSAAGSNPTQERKSRFDDTVMLRVTAKNKGVSYASKGSDIVYLSYPDYNCTGVGDGDACEADSELFVDRYNRGVRVTYSFTGKLYTLDYFALVDALTNFVVLFGLATTVVNMLAMMAMGHASKVYEGVRAQDVSMRRVHAKMAVQTVIAALSYDDMTRPRDGKESSYSSAAGGLTRQSIMEKLKEHNMPPEDAQVLAQTIMQEAQRDREAGGDEANDGQEKPHADEVTYSEWIDLVTEDLTSMKDVTNYLKKRMPRPQVTPVNVDGGKE